MINYDFERISQERKALMGLAIIWIMFFHSSGSYSSIPIVGLLHRFGNVGVDIFLLLSGIGLYYSVKNLKKRLQDRSLESRINCTKSNQGIDGFLWPLYYKKRFIRIVPLTVLCLLPWYLYLYKKDGFPNALRVILDITSLSYWIDGNNRGWYIALTIILYAIYPIIYCVIDRFDKWKFLIIAMFVFADIIVNTSIAIIFPQWFDRVNLALGRVPVFLLGCLIAPFVYNNIVTNKHVFLSICTVIALVITIGLLLYIDLLRKYAIWRYLYGILGLCLVVVLSDIFSFIHNKCIDNFFSFFGGLTLELYLTHTQILTVLSDNESLRKIISSAIVIDILAVILSIVVSIFIHKVFHTILQIERLICLNR